MTHSEETKKHLSEIRKGVGKGRKMPKESCEKISKALKGRKFTPEHVHKINHNPEKIRKTAEKHRGMKRSPEARAKMRAAKVGWIPWNKGIKGLGKGKRCYYDPVTLVTHRYFEGDQPEGWLRGRPNSCKKQKKDPDQNSSGLS
jgi:hypothetical protein